MRHGSEQHFIQLCFYSFIHWFIRSFIHSFISLVWNIFHSWYLGGTWHQLPVRSVQTWDATHVWRRSQKRMQRPQIWNIRQIICLTDVNIVIWAAHIGARESPAKRNPRISPSSYCTNLIKQAGGVRGAGHVMWMFSLNNCMLICNISVLLVCSGREQFLTTHSHPHVRPNGFETISTRNAEFFSQITVRASWLAVLAGNYLLAEKRFGNPTSGRYTVWKEGFRSANVCKWRAFQWNSCKCPDRGVNFINTCKCRCLLGKSMEVCLFFPKDIFYYVRSLSLSFLGRLSLRNSRK